VRYPKEIVLKGCIEAIIRPLEKGDEEALHRFYLDIPEFDRWCIKYDVTDLEVIRNWVDGIARGTVISIVAQTEGKIAGHASLHLRKFGATRHVARIRIMIGPEYRHRRLGTWMLLDLIQIAMDKGLENLRADFVVGIEDAAIESAYKLDFFKQALLEKYVKDPQGNRRDMLIMIKNLHKDYGDF
jgi:L-amino acid N-acyltransferase YncA